MKKILPLLVLLATSLRADTAPAAGNSAAKSNGKLTSNVYVWDQLKAEPTATGFRRAVFDGPTTSLDKLNCHVTTLNPGEQSGAPRLHLQEEIVIVKEGTVEASSDGIIRTAPAGSVIFFAAHCVTFMRNPGKAPATYIVINYSTPLTPKG
jgi:uncharacterized cupin superfamily protein